MLPLEPIDLFHQSLDRVIGVYLLETADGLALFDCGPTSTIAALKEGLAVRGLQLEDVRHLLLSHIHLDHAGGAGVLVREHPALRVHVSEIGARHLVDPGRLERSARRLWGDAFEALWGELAPVPEESVHVVGSDVLGLDCFSSPGHASHHVCYFASDGTLYAGDSVGVRIQPGTHILAAAPPPDVDLEGWQRTFAEIERRAPARFALIHFGVVDDPEEHLPRMRGTLALWAERVRAGMSEEEFVAAARRDLAESEGNDAIFYERAAPIWQSYQGLKRYWETRPNRGHSPDVSR